MQKLSNENIKNTIDNIDLLYKKEAADKTQVLASELLIEDILCLYASTYGNDTQYNVVLKKRKKTAQTILKIKGPKKNPFDEQQMREDEDVLIYGRLLKNLKIIPDYEYYKGLNVLTFGIPLLGTNFRETLKFCWSYLGNFKPKFVLAVVLQVFATVFDVITPLLTAAIIVGYTQSILEQIILIALALCGVRIIVALNSWIIVNLYNRTFFTVKSNLVVHVCEVTTKIRNYCLDSKGAGLFVRRLTQDVDVLAQGIQGISESILRIANFVGILIAVFIVSPIAFCYIFITLIIGGLIEQKRTSIYKKNDRVFRESTEVYSNFIVELVNGVKDIKLFNGRENFVRETRRKITDTRDKGLKMYDRNFRFRFIRDGLTGVFDLGFMVIIGICLCTEFMGTDPAFALVLFNYNASLGPNTFLALSALVDSVRNFNLSGERIKNLIDGDEFPKDKFGDEHLEKLQGNICLKNVTFAYNHNNPTETDVNILHNVSFDIKAGQDCAFVGKTGSGKTTILNLIGKIYDVYEGELLFDGHNINDLDEATIRNNTITISQNPHIFNMSIKDNLRIVKAKASDEEIIKVCKLACIHREILKLKKGYDTIVGENGINLSGGQRQRLAIARALLIDSAIIMFDESTSALDNVTQNKVINNIKSDKKGSTIIMVAHRLSTIKDAQKIIFVYNGEIAAQGNHNELFENCKQYRELYELEEN